MSRRRSHAKRPAAARVASQSHRRRLALIYVVMTAMALALVGRAVELQLVDHGFLSKQGAERFSRVLTVTAHRGTVTDRNGEPLAVSTPVDSVWLDPKMLDDPAHELPQLAHALGLARGELARRVRDNQDRQFLYVARGMSPDEAGRIAAMDLPGVNLSGEYRRYYPAGEVAGQLVGFTSIDDVGQDGIELAYNRWLAGGDGAERVIRDSTGQSVEQVQDIRAMRPGHDLALSLDLRIQYLAYRALKSAVLANHAASGSIVVLDVATGEVLAMADQPSYNPNDRDQFRPADYRNRAVTDLFEPGSSIKPFIVAAGLASGRFSADSRNDTRPGFIKVGARTFQDEHDLGVVDLATVLAKSSNVGMAKLALQLPPREIWSTLTRFGFGHITDSAFPGESAGVLTNYAHWRPIRIATMSHGYSLSVTALQLAHAYATIGALGLERPVSLLRVASPPGGQRILPASVCRSLVGLLEAVTTQEGATGVRARIPGYRVAGKTGTAYKYVNGSYSTDQYTSIFAGLAPASAPRLAAVVVINDPSAGRHMGGDVSAPVFSTVVGGALRLLGVAPDELSTPASLPPTQRVALR
jgi:cell division protein FtsI (penicillin-binding protein 3)